MYETHTFIDHPMHRGVCVQLTESTALFLSASFDETGTCTRSNAWVNITTGIKGDYDYLTVDVAYWSRFRHEGWVADPLAGPQIYRSPASAAALVGAA